MLQIHIDNLVKSIIPPVIITFWTYGEKYAGYDLGTPAETDRQIFNSAADRQHLSAALQHIRHHYRRPSDRHQGAGGRRRFRTAVFHAGAGQHRFHQRTDGHHRPAFRRPRLPRPAPFGHHRHPAQFRLYLKRRRRWPRSTFCSRS